MYALRDRPPPVVPPPYYPAPYRLLTTLQS